MKKQTVIGELRLHRDGYGFVTTGKADEEDVFIPAKYVGDALHTDIVEVSVVPGRGAKSEGRIKKIVERRVTKLVGRLEQAGRRLRVIADDRRVRHAIHIPEGKAGKGRHGNNVVVMILRYPAAGQPMLGEVIEILGERGLETTEERAIVIRHHLPNDFPQRVLDEADMCFTGEATLRLVSAHTEKSRSGADTSSGRTDEERRDLRNIDFVTIDGESARDFDDAVAVKKLDARHETQDTRQKTQDTRRETGTSSGVIRLWVSIADVSHFVKERSALDHEAYKRGTSVYFPADCIPMLPEQLSNDLCSLKPDVDRFTMTAEMDVDQHGKIVRRDFYASVIRSRRRMTYTEIKKILSEGESSLPLCKGEVEGVDHDLLPPSPPYKGGEPDFHLMEECFRRLRAQRLARGSIDFDLPEPQIVIDLTGDIENVVKAERHVGHMMIEEFMVAANEAVAEFLTKTKTGCIYRVHEHPDSKKLREFAMLLYNLGHHVKIGEKVPPGALARVVDKVKGRPEERLVNMSLLRSMQQAVYSPENLGHYGLASQCYCHFTSPIRRYPDLVVHRLLKIALSRQDTRRKTQDARPGLGLAEIAEHCSRRERIAMEAEREMLKLHVALFMKDKIDEEYDGIISHVTKFGFFVELKEYFVEGLVHIDSLPSDRYTFDEKGYCLHARKRKKGYRIGDPVRIAVSEVDIPNREINFNLV